jgi:uncharacterized cupin superfamily protein
MINKNKAIIRLRPDAEGFGQNPDELEAEEFSSAVPVQHTHSYWDDDDIGLYVGLWDTEAMIEAGGPYACDEFMWLIEGECRIRNNRTGEIDTVKAGTPFIIPRGYDCQWHQPGYLRKFYVISEHPDEEMPAMPAHEGVVIPQADAVLTDVAGDMPFAISSGAKPQQNICYEDTAGRFFAGTWACDAFDAEPCPFPYNEFAYVQDGSITLEDAEGTTQVFSAGDAFFVPQGTECRAKVANSVRLFIAVVKSA